jgi:hypothetical protein
MRRWAMVFLLAGCGSGPSLEPRLSALQSQIFTPTCALSDCHAEMSAKGNLVLAPGRSRAELVGVDADAPMAKARGQKRVVPGSPFASFLFRKLDQSPALLPPDEGDPMPLGHERLAQEKIDTVRAWIERGAADD